MTAAKNEGQVTIYAGPGATLLPIHAGIFQKRFPEIHVVTASGDTVQRVLSERRAGKFLVDVVMGGTTPLLTLHAAKALDSIRNVLMLPEVSDESKWWGGKHYYTDPEKEHVLSYIGNSSTGDFAYNTTLVNPHEFNSLRDFLNPKWKGKISIRDPRTVGPGSSTMRMFYFHPKLGPEYMMRLFGEMEITLFRDPRQGIDWLVTGKYPINFFSAPSVLGRAQAQGLPVAPFGHMQEGAYIVSHSGVIGIANRAPHPNAAKVLVNWLLSREGQMTMQAEYARAGTGTSNSRRIDIPKDMVPPAVRLQEGVDYMDVETLPTEPGLKVLNEALARAGK